MEITEDKYKKLRDELGAHGAMTVMCILFDAPRGILRSKEEVELMSSQAQKGIVFSETISKIMAIPVVEDIHKIKTPKKLVREYAAYFKFPWRLEAVGLINKGPYVDLAHGFSKIISGVWVDCWVTIPKDLIDIHDQENKPRFIEREVAIYLNDNN